MIKRKKPSRLLRDLRWMVILAIGLPILYIAMAVKSVSGLFHGRKGKEDDEKK